LESVIEPSDSFSEKVDPAENLKATLLNRRNYNRYFINEFPVKDIGAIIEIAKGGMRIKKFINEEITDSQLTIPIISHEIKTDIVWQDSNYIGLRFEREFDIAHLVKKIAKRIKDPDIKPERFVSDYAITAYTKKDILSTFINLMAELENPETDITQLKIYVKEISDVYRETGKLEDEKSGGNEEIKEPASSGPIGLERLLIREAVAISDTGVEINNADFAIARLGLDSVKKISTDFIRKNISEIEISMSEFNNYESYHILKSVMFKHLAPFFGFKDEEGEGSLLLALETQGIDILMTVSLADSQGIRAYYISPERVYSEISRHYENNRFGRDLLSINKLYFEKNLGMFNDHYDGYILAHLMLNPCYTLSNDIRLIITKRKLIFSFLAYLTFIAISFIIDKDREGGSVLINILSRTGMDEGEIMVFLNERISEANNVLKSLGLKKKIASVTLPHSSFKNASYLHKGIHYKYFMQSFENFVMMKSINRMALRYEDPKYTHFILKKLITSDDFGLKSKSFCVIPCKNISHDELYIEDFSFFDLVIFKDIDRLPVSHMKEFVKLWESFEGKIIATFSSFSFLDIDNKDLYLLLKNHIVDFPSYFSNKEIYERMIDQTINYIKPYVGEHEADKNDYLKDVYSMDYIKTSELTSYV
jgi:hypothetical protein